MHGPIFGEFLGTLVLVALGDGVVANVLLKGSKGENSGWIVITTGWALAVLLGIVVSVGVGGVAHLNPAVTIAAAVTGGDYSMVVSYVVAQIVGAFCGAALVWIIYLPHWVATENQGLKLAVFCTGPAIRSPGSNVITEFIGTVMLVVAGFAIASGGFAGTGLPGGMGPYLWGMLVWGIGLSFGGPTGFAINPARDLGPRIAHALLPIAGKGKSDWSYSWIPVMGPVAGGIIGALICKATGIA